LIVSSQKGGINMNQDDELKKAGSMTSQDDEDKQNMRIMWMASGVIVLFILAMMGLSMLSDTGTGSTEMSSQSRSAPAK
jgi:hypothetical protein